jgi:hypothetical protein
VYRDMIFALGNRYHRYRVTKGWHDEELANPAPLCLDEDNDVEPYCVPMEIDAQRSRKIDHNLLCDLCESDGRNRPYESRHNENAIRLALDFHGAEHCERMKGEDGDGQSLVMVANAHKYPIAVKTMEDAIVVRDWCNFDQNDLRQPQREKAEDKMREAVKALMHKHLLTGITPRDVRRHKICTNEEAKNIFEELAREGISEPFARGMTDKGGQLTKAYRLTKKYQ